MPTDRVFVPVTRFLANKPAETVKAYGHGLNEFCRVIFETEDIKKLENYVKKATNQQIFNDMGGFADYLDGRGTSRNTKKLRLSAVRSYFQLNDIVIPKDKFRLFFEREERKSDEELDETTDQAFTIEQVKTVSDQLTPAMRTVFLFLFVSGCRVNEALQVRLSDIDLDKCQVKIRAGTSKTKTGRTVLITRECTELIKTVWLPRRTEYMKSAQNRNKGLREQEGVRRAGKRITIDQDTRLFPFTVMTFRESLGRALNRIGLNQRTDKGRYLYHVHSLRKSFRTIVGRHGSVDGAETLLGHAPGMTASYRRLSLDDCIQDYKKAEPFLTIGLSEAARSALTTRDIHAAAIVSLQQENARILKEMGTLKQIIEFAEEKRV